METETRKSEHIRICLEKDVEYTKSNGFECYEFEHNALPELDFENIDTSMEFLGKKLKVPIIIEAITGGSPEAEMINKNLATAAQELGVAMGVGSQRAALEKPELAYTYEVRDVAPDIVLLGNIGGANLAEYRDRVKNAVDMIGADGLAVHLNAAQEMAQKEGERNFKNMLENIKSVTESGIPVVVKEVGCGITGHVAKKLESAGVKAIDVSGSGGTSWIKVDYYRGRGEMKNFLEWGVPTAECLRQCMEQGVKVPVIASGGIRNGLEAAKAIAMGASLVGLALPLLKPATESSDAVREKIQKIIDEFRTAMLLIGAGNIEELRKAKLVRI